MADLKVDIATVFSGKKAFNDAVKSTIGLNNQVKTLAKSYLGLFTVQRLGYAAVNAAKAFAADDKAARTLSRSLDNLGLAFADPSVKDFIANLEKQFGVLDDQLRPAFQRLLTTTGDVSKAQSLLKTALDLSAASGQDVVTVAGDLSKGYVGQTRALAKYGIGLTQAQLKAMSFEDVQKRINELFGGQAALSADTYAGKLDKLTVAARNAQEIIGKGLLDSLAKLGGGGTEGLDNTIKAMETFAKVLSGIANTFADVFQAVTNPLAFYKQNTTKPKYMGATPAITSELQKAATEKAIAKAKAAQVKATKAQTAALKEQTALQKAGTLFDLQQTQIIAALKGEISADERKRLELQLAILTGNTSEASKLAGELAKSQGLSQQLAAYLASLPDAKNPFTAWKSYLDMIEAQVRRITTVSPAPITSMASGYGVTGTQYSLPSASQFTSAGGVDVTVNVNAGSVIAQEGLVDVIRDSLLNDSLQAKFSAIYRQGGLGQFG